ncbi:MAG: ABC transporter permease [Flavobacteriales bacterium]
MLKETRYTAKGRQNSLKMLQAIAADVPQAHALGYRLAQRNIKAKYRQSFLGVLWAVFPPLATSLVWIILRGQGVVSFGETGVSYSVFVLTGTFLWQVFSISITTFLNAINSNKSLLTKINFPREALFYSAVYEILFNALFSFFVVVIAMFAFGVAPGVNILYFLACLPLLILLGLVIGLLLLPVATLFSDVIFGLPVVLQFAMYLTPVVYPQPVYQGLGKILDLNPVTPLLNGARSGLLGVGDLPEWSVLLLFSAVLFVLFVFGLVLMRIAMEILIERMGS